MNEVSRREFVLFMGRGLALSAALSTLPNCATHTKKSSLPFTPLTPTREDALKLANGFQYEILLRWGQNLNSQGEKFGFNNDYLAFIPLVAERPYEGLLWVNHEYHDPCFNSGWRVGEPRTAQQVEIERKEVGGSIAHIRRKEDGRWDFVPQSSYNRRLDAYTPIPLIADEPIQGKKVAIGTFGNCAGGITPWGTILSCEENYSNFIGEVSFENGKRHLHPGDEYLTWEKFVHLPPEHYGWVVEVDPKTAKAKKLTALGRFAHECATTTVASDGRTVVYTGDDAEDEHIYKFIASKPGSLEHGDLFVANTQNGRWLPLSLNSNPILRKHFKSQTECLIRTREAAKLVGATPLDRPEDIEIDPHTKSVFVACTMNKSRGRPFGALMKIEEKNANPLSMEFKFSTFVAGGPKTGFACPDNLAFDSRGNLWMCSDMSGSSMGKKPYESFGNNGLFYIPLSGDYAGQALQVASAPIGAEFTGPTFAPDGSLFLSVQHPGEHSINKGLQQSHWPDGGNSRPAPCVVQISGPSMTALLSS